MKRVRACVLAAVLLSAVLSAAAADAPLFYTTMLQRGIVTFEKGESARALDLLHIHSVRDRPGLHRPR